MKIKSSFCLGLTLTMILLVGAHVSAQSSEPKLEVGTQVTSFTLSGLLYGYNYNASELGFGGRITYNFNRSVAVEAESNFFPHRSIFGGLGEGRALQAQFGLKAGKRFKKFGVFGKVRPGFLSIGEVFSNEPGSSAVFQGNTFTNVRIGRQTHFTTDVGGVLELYPSPRSIVRFDAGDTIVRYGPHFDYTPPTYELVRLPAYIKHNFQFSAGVGFRLGHAASSQPAPSPRAGQSRVKAPRFEAGVQFTSLSVNPPDFPCPDICLSGGPPRSFPEPGLGGRFTFNLSDSIGLEAETNFFGHDEVGWAGHMFQAQFGIKAGKRFRKFGVFAKARPGFVGSTKVNQLVATHTTTIFNQQVTYGEFRVGTKKYFSTDIGGVLEFYVSHRVLTRMDVGDTIIHYSERDGAGFALNRLIVRVPPETRHNLQFSAGLGFRF